MASSTVNDEYFVLIRVAFVDLQSWDKNADHALAGLFYPVCIVFQDLSLCFIDVFNRGSKNYCRNFT